MPRPETQLREYFDAGVERITAGDVMARVRAHETGFQSLETTRNFKPAWAAVGAFAATLVGLGGLTAVLNLAPRVTGEAGAGPVEIVEVGGGSIGVWLIAAVVAAVVAGTTVWLIHRSGKITERGHEIESENRKVMVMKTIERTDVESQEPEESAHRSRWPIVLIVVLAAAVVGLVAWMTLAMRPNSPNAAPPEIARLMEDYNAAWNAYDADALEELVTSTYVVRSEVVDQDLDGVRSYLFPLLESWDWHVTTDGPYYAVPGVPEGRWLVSTEGSTITRSGTDRAHTGIITVVTSMDGALLVDSHYFMGG